MNVRCVIFDLDGTLLDSIRAIAWAGNETMKSMGFPPHPEDAYKTFIGSGVHTILARALPPGDVSEEAIYEATRIYRSFYDQGWKEKTTIFDGVEPLLNLLEQRRCAMAILSNKPHDDLERHAKHFFPQHPFTRAYGARQGVPLKPDPASALEIAEAAGCLPRETLFVGDMREDLETAKAAGMQPVFAAWGYGRPTEEQLAGVTLRPAFPADIATVL